MLPRVLILYTGGTFGMDLHPNPRTHLKSIQKNRVTLAVPNLSPPLLRKRLLDQVPELQRIAKCDVDVLLNRDSAHIGPKEWLLFSKKIQHDWDRYDGFVLLHGTDTLAYTASALSFLLRPCLKPVVLTGAQRPLSALRTDARTNLISAVEIAAHGPRKIVNQVTVFFGDKLFQGNRVRKISANDFAAFVSPHCSPLAIVGTTIRYSDFSSKTSSRRVQKYKPRFSERIMVAHVTPAFPSKSISKALLPYLDGLVLIVFHSGTAPTHDPAFRDFLRAAQDKKLPITIATEGSTQPPITQAQAMHYAAGSELISHGALWAGSMTPECTFVKTSFLLAQSPDLKTFSRLWKNEFAGEGSR